MSDISRELGPLPGQFSIMESFVPTVAFPSFTKLCGGNALRWGLIIGAPLNLTTALPTNSGIQPAPQAQVQVAAIAMNQYHPVWCINFREFGSLVQMSWFGASDTVTNIGNWLVIEVLIQQ